MIRNYRSQLPFGEDVLVQIRKDVMTQIERDARPWMGIFLRATIATSALLLFVSLPVIRREKPVASSELRVAREASPVRPAQLATRNSQPEPVITPTSHRVRRRPIKRTEPVPPEPAEVRIELQTSDPDVRIIWFTNDTGDTR